MEKPSQQHTIYKGVSALEGRLLSRISESNILVFGAQEAKRLTGFGKTRTHNLLASLARKGTIIKILRNRYCLKEAVHGNSFAIATNALAPSYVSFWSALSFYGFTEQQVAVVQLAAPKQFKKIEVNGLSIQSIAIKPRNFFGYLEENGFAIASREKALVDSAANFGNVGGFNEFAKCIKNAWGEINKKTFVEFLLKTNNKSLNSRTGYLVEESGLFLGKGLLERLHAKRSRGFVKLNPSKNKSNKYNKKWNIIVNDSVKGEKIV